MLAGSIKRVTFHSAVSGFCVLRIKASFLKASVPTTAEGIEKYLGSGMIRGCPSPPDASP